MKLPITNRKWTIIRVIGINFLIITFSFILQDVNSLLVFYPAIIVMAALYIYKNNIQNGYLKNDTIILKYNWKEITIPVKEVISVNSAIAGYNDFKNPWTTFFVLELKNKYHFGRKLELEYRHQNFHIEEPREISIIKAIIENQGNIDADAAL
ncbi:hypothetical protein [Natronoflexus pectinivorans]|uniref:Uncharacterized protein n=1 Tax=Natronoflexus pectinivorans TaxID=682526 RepID=A0A4R2GJH5_9BACT|nr:hypothetical protein [Natronoflexus pectinivorans]TCO08472.1 hypothetical protein EV194_105282 [Natronoflexus pectinivorans]